jgi:hypothetical protein
MSLDLTATCELARAPIDPYAWYNLVGLLVGGCGWLVVYGLAVYQGFKKKTCAIPAYAICLNVGWEFLTSFFVANPVPAWLWLNRAWLAVDLVIVYTLFRYGRPRPMEPRLARHFHAILACTFVLGIVGQAAYIRTFCDAYGYGVAFSVDLVMAVLFVLDHLAAPAGDGVTLAIAFGRLWGDLGVCIQCWFLFPQVNALSSFAFYHVLFVAILSLDGLYISLVLREALSRARMIEAAPTHTPALVGQSGPS